MPRRALTRVLAAVALIAATLVGALPFAPPATATTQTYAYTGGPQIYVVPAGINTIAVTLVGAAGATPTAGGSGGTGGNGASVTATLNVRPGEVLQVNVGGSGDVSGWNGGGGPAGARGGGASDIRQPTFSTSSSCAYSLSCDISSRVVVAGGGGGGGRNGGNGGNAGYAAVLPTAGQPTSGAVTGGGGATASTNGNGAGGENSDGNVTAGSGANGVGGQGAYNGADFSGGGGGGYYAGGGGGINVTGTGATSGGGGGLSWAGGSTVAGAPSFGAATNTGNGSVTINPPSAIPQAVFNYSGSEQYFSVPQDVTAI